MRTASSVLVAVVAVAAGCSTDPTPSAGPDTTTESGASLTASSVPNPLDASAFRDAPCRLMAERQARELGLPVAEQEVSSGRPTCIWRADKDDENPFDALSIRFQTDNGLAAIAQQCKGRSDCDTWTQDMISDYPVIRANGRLESKYGLCRLFVGVADDVAFLVADGDQDAVRKGANEGDAGGPRCDRADRAAAFVIQTLKADR